jgi:hypothetical protein
MNANEVRGKVLEAQAELAATLRVLADRVARATPEEAAELLVRIAPHVEGLVREADRLRGR